jgi:hypothetical protein
MGLNPGTALAALRFLRRRRRRPSGDEVRRSVQQWSLSGGSVAGAAWLLQSLVLDIAEEAWPEEGVGLLDVG